MKKNKIQLKNKNLLVFLFLLFSTFYGLLSTSVLAQTNFTTNLGDFPGGEFSATKLVNLVGGLACYFIRFGMVAVVVAFVVYGIMFLKSRGNPQEFGGARKSLAWGVVGGLVIFGVFTIILSVSEIVGFGASNYTQYPILKIIQCQ